MLRSKLFVPTLVSILASVGPAAVESAKAETCFAVDGDGTYDRDGAVNGVVTITSASTSPVPPAATPYDCTALDFVVQPGATLNLEGDETTGEIAALRVGDLTIESGGVISADGWGCRAVFDGTNPAWSEAPDASNVCTAAGLTAYQSGGGSHGGSGGGNSSGFTYCSATTPLLFGATGGADDFEGDGHGGAGGGVVSITAAKLTHDGVISANGEPGGSRLLDSIERFSGGGAGGSINIVATTINGTSGTFVARGGDAPGTGGGGGGGRIAIAYQGGGYEFDAGDFDVAGAAPATGPEGQKGTVYVHDTSADTVRVFHGFTFADEDYVAAQWLADDTATNQYCNLEPPPLRPSITAENLILGGGIDCRSSLRITQTGPGGALTLRNGTSLSADGALTLEAATSLDVGMNVTIQNTRQTTDLTLVFPDGDDQSWSGVTIAGAAEGRIVIDAAGAVALLNGSFVSGNPAWRNLTALTIDQTSSIHADGSGCQSPPPFDAADGRAPVAGNVCTSGATGSGKKGVIGGSGGSAGGGGGHGGAGGAGAIGAGGATYDSNTRLFGASAASSYNSRIGEGRGFRGGAGGGLIDIAVNGTFTNDGSISANGGAGGGGLFLSTGGGAGGSIRLKATEYACTGGTGSFSAAGGDGAATAGGGGGGRILFDVASDSCSAAPLSALDPSSVVPAGSGNDGAGDGGLGTLVLASPALSCGDPVSSEVSRAQAPRPRSVSSSDALFVLSAAVGSKSCDLCICDTNDSGSVTAADALLTLQVSIGVPATLQCPPCL